MPVLNGPLILMQTRRGYPLADGELKPFVFCPYCALKLEEVFSADTEL